MHRSIRKKTDEPLNTRNQMLFPWAVGLIACVVYVLTLSRGVFPGQSSVFTALAAGLDTKALAAHPLWSIAVRWIAQLPLLTLPIRLNLFNAICAALSVGFLGQIVSNWLLANAREMRIPTGPFADDRTKEAASAFAKIEYASVMDFNRRVMMLSTIGGCAAALAFAFCTPFWSAATRLGLQPFDLLLALLIAKACEWHRNTRNLVPALITAFLCGVGFVESHVFVVLIPLFLALLLNNRLRLNLAWERQMVFSVAAAAAGALLGLVLLWHVRAIAAADTPAISFRLTVGDLIRDHYQLVLHILPRADWIWIVVFAFGPALVAVFTAKHSLRNHSFVAYVIHVVLTAVTLSCLFNAPLSPWGLLRFSGILPIMAYVGVAVATGYLVTYWLLLTLPDGRKMAAPPSSTATKTDAPKQASSSKTSTSSRATRWVGYTASGMILASICVLPFLNRIEADGRRGEFVDAYAQHVLDAMGSRTWLVTDGWLDNHLKVLAQSTHKTLHLICLQRETDSYHLLEIQHAIDQDAAFTGMRVHLKNMASLSSPAFLQEWLLMDPHVADHVVVFEFGDFWGEAGLLAKPELVFFSGTHEALQPEALNDLLAAHMRFWDRMEPLLNPATQDPAGLAADYRKLLRRHTGFVGNQLGVMLQDLNRPQDAFAVYTRVLRLDPENLSAQFNRYALTLEGIEPNQKEEALKALRSGLTQWGEKLNMGLVTRLYGTVRSPQVIVNAGLRWLGGQPGQAELALRRAVAASPGTNGVDYLSGLADLLFLEGKHEQSEATCRDILRLSPGNLQAMLCMMRIEQARGKPEAAKVWLDQLPPQLATDTNVLLEKAIILSALKQHASARKTIQDALDKNPKELRFWLMLITILLNEGKTDEAELVILPKMRVIVQDMPGAEFMLYAASGFIEQARGSAHLRRARDNFATAFALRPGNMDFLEKALALDLQLHDNDATERHARMALRANRKNAIANYALGGVLLEHDEVEAARDFLQRSLEVKTTLPALADYAEALRRMGQLAEAERTIRQALAMDAHSAPALKTLATILLDAKRPNEAATAAKQAVSLVASNAFLQTTYVRCLVAQGHTDEARKEMASLLQAGTNLPPVLYTQVQALSKQVDAH